MSDVWHCSKELDGRAYPGYRALAGRIFDLGVGALSVDHVQPDPFAPPSRIHVVVSPAVTRLPELALGSATARRATADHLHRRVRAALGAGRGLAIADVGQQVLDRTGVTLTADGEVTVRLTAALPAAGRRILGRAAAELLGEALPRALDVALAQYDAGALARHVAVVEDQVALRAQLAAQGLVAFLADGSVLARRSGVDDRPLAESVPLCAPDALARTLIAPHAGPLRGLAVPVGVTAIVGGGYHGKSTLLAALSACVYDHVPGDGREACVTRAAAVGVRAEDGRSVRGVDLRPFIGRLPFGRSTERFDTDDASGSTSQAAAVVEALEAGADTLLVDEDTAAANFMVRDARMRRLIAAADEPITPFLDRVRQLWTEREVSTVLVVGGAGDYLDVADTVIQMRDYAAIDVTSAARAVAATLPLGEAAPCAPGAWPVAAPRIPAAHAFDARGDRGRARVRARALRAIEFGDHEIDVGAVAQLVETGQARFMGDVLQAFGRGFADDRRSVAELLDEYERRLARDGMTALASLHFGDRSVVRRFELAAVLNRYRGLRLSGGT